MNDLVEKFKDQIDLVKRGGSLREPKPHKLVMILAVITLADRGYLKQNKIYFDEELEQVFREEFELIQEAKDWCQPALPYFHLRSSDFWFHKIIPGREEIYSTYTTSGGGRKRIVETIEYAYLSDDVYAVISDATSRQEIRKFLLSLLKP